MQQGILYIMHLSILLKEKTILRSGFDMFHLTDEKGHYAISYNGNENTICDFFIVSSVHSTHSKIESLMSNFFSVPCRFLDLSWELVLGFNKIALWRTAPSLNNVYNCVVCFRNVTKESSRLSVFVNMPTFASFYEIHENSREPSLFRVFSGKPGRT